jgi:hypothetical protein
MLLFAGQAHAGSRCGAYPEKVYQLNYGGWADCRLKRLGAPALWKGLPKKTKQVMRFAFTEGHGMFFRVVTIHQKMDGAAALVVKGSKRRDGVGVAEEPMTPRHIRLSAEEVAKIDQLGTQAGAWDFDVGTWDGDELYMHCQVLEMERANADGYRYSSVNIGCNHPEKLMPLVDEVARLAGLETAHNGKLYY